MSRTVWFCWDATVRVEGHPSEKELRMAGVPEGWEGGELTASQTTRLWAMYKLREAH